MGGSVKGVGIMRPNVEFNIGADPESNFLLFNSSEKSQITLYPWENVMETVMSKVEYFFNTIIMNILVIFVYLKL